MAKQEYPKWVYRGDESRHVVDADKHAELGPGWHESPVDAAAAQASAPVSSAPVAPIAPVNPPADTAPTAETAQDDAEAKSLYATAVPVLVEKLKDCSKEMLERVQRFEAQNPKGARKGVLTAIESLLAAQTVSG